MAPSTHRFAWYRRFQSSVMPLVKPGWWSSFLRNGTRVFVALAFLLTSSCQTISDGLAQALNTDLPVKLDTPAYSSVSSPRNFRPRTIACTADNLGMRLSPGDYTCDVQVVCVQLGTPGPRRGSGYELAPLEGKSATALATLLARGTANGVPHRTLQTIAWEVQASVPLSDMPEQHQTIVRQQIPEMANQLEGDWLQQVQGAYNFLAKTGLVPPLSQKLASYGVSGRLALEALRFRDTVRRNALNYDRLSQEVMAEDIPPGSPQASAWSQTQPGITAQLVIRQGYAGLNTLNFRISSDAVQGAGAADSLIMPVAYVLPGAGQAAGRGGVTLGRVIGVVAEGEAAEAVAGLMFIAFALKRAQALMITLRGSGERTTRIPSRMMDAPGNCTPDDHEQMQNQVDFYCKTSRACNGSTSPSQAAQNIAIIQACIIARNRINNQCFMGGDDRHVNSVSSEYETLSRCQARIGR